MPRIDRAVTDVSETPEQVYAAFVDADALEAWLPPDGMTAEIADADLVAGGGFTMTLRYDEVPEGGGKTTERTDVTHVAIDELVEPERVVWGVEFDSDDPDTAGRMTMTWTFTAHDGGTRAVFVSRYESAEALKQVLAMGIVEGATSAINQIDELVA